MSTLNNMNRFTAPINIYDFTKYVYTCVYFPEEITDTLPLKEFPRLRINALIDGMHIKGALMPDKVGSPQTKHLLREGYADGRRIWYLQVPKKVLKTIDKTIGDLIEVSFEIADQDEVDIHPTVEALLSRDHELNEKWNSLTSGKKRSLMHPVLAAKSDATLEKRIDTLVEQIEDA